MKRRWFKKAARKAWRLIQEQKSARLTWRESEALHAYAARYPDRVVKNWNLIKDPRPRYIYRNSIVPRVQRPNPYANPYAWNGADDYAQTIFPVLQRLAMNLHVNVEAQIEQPANEINIQLTMPPRDDEER